MQQAGLAAVDACFNARGQSPATPLDTKTAELIGMDM
jgi:hypothetical protein